MNSREKILAAVKKNQPTINEIPSIALIDAIHFENPQQTFSTVLQTIGGKALIAESIGQVEDYVHAEFSAGKKFVTNMNGLSRLEKLNDAAIAHELEDVEVAVLKASFGVAENSAIWVTGSSVSIRVLPFICQHLVVILHASDIVHNMHEAYERIGADAYDYGVFIAGPSKTADIEQSLVLGAHGPKSMTIFLLPPQ